MLYRFARPALFSLDAERAHGLALTALKLRPGGSPQSLGGPLQTEVAGLVFPNPLGMAAGFDKDGEVPDALLGLGFGFAEVGSITPRPQAGNPKPRLFRLVEDRAVINRMGFNNAGIDAYLQRLARRPRGSTIVGANVGINKEGADPERDYPALIAAIAPYADYAVINVSSPNTPGLRDLQGEAQLRAILRAVAAHVPQPPPLLVKIAPDIGEADLEALVGTASSNVSRG